MFQENLNMKKLEFVFEARDSLHCIAVAMVVICDGSWLESV